jgi:hypothetical protein
MKINDQMRFPHPVLWSGSSDYKSGAFSVSLNFEERTETGALSVRYRMELDEPAVCQLLEQRDAAVGLFITCPETYYNILHPISREGGTLEIAPGQLRGRVVIRPVIWSVVQVNGFSSSNVHPEFSGAPVEFRKGAVIALGEEMIINVGREKLLPMESIFSLSLDDNVPGDQVRVQLEDEVIKILAAKSTFDRIHLLRGTKSGRTFLLNGVYLPAVMEVLSVIADDGARFEGRRWHRVFSAKLDHLGIRPGTTGHLEGAQKLLLSPLGRVTDIVDLGSA